MVVEHPFQTLFETLGRVPDAHASEVNRRAYEQIRSLLSVSLERNGRCILLRAPRAGHGKTHLLSHIRNLLQKTHVFIPLNRGMECHLDVGAVIEDSLGLFFGSEASSGGACELDHLTRRWLALALQPLVITGEVPCQDREGALEALVERPVECLDFHHPEARIAHWVRDNFNILGPRLALETARAGQLSHRQVAFWVNALFQFAIAKPEEPWRLGQLIEAIQQGAPGERIQLERLETLFGMLSMLMRVVLVADNLEGFPAEPTVTLRFASFLGNIRQSVQNLDVIISLNQDIWDRAFKPFLSGGLADRLSEIVVDLRPLTEGEMLALLECRAPGFGTRLLAQMDRSEPATYARGLMRMAGLAWPKALGSDREVDKRTHESVTPARVVRPESIESVSFQVFETGVRYVDDWLAGPPQPSTPASKPKESSDADPKRLETAGELTRVGQDFGQSRAQVVPISTDRVDDEVASPEIEAVEGFRRPSGDRVDELLRQFRERYGRR